METLLLVAGERINADIINVELIVRTFFQRSMFMPSIVQPHHFDCEVSLLSGTMHLVSRVKNTAIGGPLENPWHACEMSSGAISAASRLFRTKMEVFESSISTFCQF